VEDAFYKAVEERLIPAWSQMLHAQAIHVDRTETAEPGLADVFLVQDIDYPSRAAIDEALALVQPMYGGQHHHIIYAKLAARAI